MVTIAILNAIMARDPDGISDTPPTNDQYLAHMNWAVNTYGIDAWKEYMGSNWGEAVSDF